MPNTQSRPKTTADNNLRSAREQEILDAATSLFAEHGFADTDTQLLADRLGVGKGTLYRYFPSKQDLFLAAVDRGMRRLCEHIDASMADLKEPSRRITQVVRSYLSFFADHPELVELFIQERAHFRNRKKPAYFEYRETNRERLRAMYRSYIEQGQIRDMPVDRILNVLGDLLYGTMITNYFSGRQSSLETQAEDILDVVFHGILSEDERKRRAPPQESASHA